jgi:hypothetical protein
MLFLCPPVRRSESPETRSCWRCSHWNCATASYTSLSPSQKHSSRDPSRTFAIVVSLHGTSASRGLAFRSCDFCVSCRIEPDPGLSACISTRQPGRAAIVTGATPLRQFAPKFCLTGRKRLVRLVIQRERIDGFGIAEGGGCQRLCFSWFLRCSCHVTVNGGNPALARTR